MFVFEIGIYLDIWSRRNLHFRDENNKELYQAVIVASDELSWKNPKQLTESFCDILGGDGKFKSAMVLGTKELGSVLLSDVSKMNE